MNKRFVLMLVALVAGCGCGELPKSTQQVIDDLIGWNSPRNDTVEYVSARELLEAEPRNMHKLEPVFVTSIDYLNNVRAGNGLPPLNALPVYSNKTNRVYVDTKLARKYAKLKKHLKKQTVSLIGLIKRLLCSEQARLSEKQVLTRLHRIVIDNQVKLGGKSTPTQDKQAAAKQSRPNSIFSLVNLTTPPSDN